MVCGMPWPTQKASAHIVGSMCKAYAGVFGFRHPTRTVQMQQLCLSALYNKGWVSFVVTGKWFSIQQTHYMALHLSIEKYEQHCPSPVCIGSMPLAFLISVHLILRVFSCCASSATLRVDEDNDYDANPIIVCRKHLVERYLSRSAACAPFKRCVSTLNTNCVQGVKTHIDLIACCI